MSGGGQTNPYRAQILRAGPIAGTDDGDGPPSRGQALLQNTNSRLFPAHIGVSPVLGHPLQRDRSKRLVRGRAQLGKTKEVQVMDLHD